MYKAHEKSPYKYHSGESDSFGIRVVEELLTVKKEKIFINNYL